MKKLTMILLMAVSMLAYAGGASATTIYSSNGNLIIPGGAGYISDNTVENQVTGVGQILSGSGYITSVGSGSGSYTNYCSSNCFLGYTFSAVVTGFDPGATGTNDPAIVFDQLVAQFYVFQGSPSSANMVNGDLILTAAGITQTVNCSGANFCQNGQVSGQLFSTLTGYSTADPTSYSFSGYALLSATGGSAMGDFLQIPGLPLGANFNLSTQGTFLNGVPVSITASLGYQAVPEPNDLGMMGLGLLMVGLLGLRFRQSRFRMNAQS